MPKYANNETVRPLSDDYTFGLIFDWNNAKDENFSEARAAVFHYCLFIHDMKWFAGVSGISRWRPSSDFLVSLVSTLSEVGTENEQAGTFMHELGHNLGLRHGGGDDTKYKPNYLSVMNYAFQMPGLRFGLQDGRFDYSRFTLPVLNENALNETIGLNGGTAINSYGTRYFCANGTDKVVDQANGPIDWNCDSDMVDSSVKTNINNDTFMDLGLIPLITNLNSYNDWANLIYTGGAIGQPGAQLDLPTNTQAEELTIEESLELSVPYRVTVFGSGDSIFPSGTTVYQTITVENLGIASDTYSVLADSSMGWADLSGVPIEIPLAAGQSLQVPISINIPISASSFQTDQLILSVSSQTDLKVNDTVSIYTSVLGPKVLDVKRLNTSPTNADTVDFAVTFLTQVAGVDVSDFALVANDVTGAFVSAVNGSGSNYTVTVNTGMGNGMIRLDVIDNNSITSLGSDPLGGVNIGDGDFRFGELYAIINNPTFSDAPFAHPYWQEIEILYGNGYTAGCSTSPLLFCPDVSMSRAQSAVFMLRGNFGSGYVPVTPTHFFADSWKNAPWGEGWAESMYLEGLTAGCGASPLKFCPDEILTNVQLAVFSLRLKHGMNYAPPPATGTVFADLTDMNFWGTGWAEQAYVDGLIPSCGTDIGSGKPMFCSDALVSRGFGASVIVKAKNLTMP